MLFYILRTTFFVFVTSIFAYPVTGLAQLDEHLQKITSRVEDAVSSAKLGGKVDVIDLEITDFAKLGLKAGIETYQNSDKTTYTRSEKLVFTQALQLRTPGPAFLQSEISKGSEVEFLRQFDRQRDALNIVKNPPYSPARIPITAEKALLLDNGDYVRFQSRMALKVGAGLGHSLGIVQVVGARNYIIYGDFQLEVYRKSDQRVGLRISSLQKNSKTLKLGLKHNHILDVFALVGLGTAEKNIVTKKINEVISEKILPTEILEIDASSSNGSLISVEYEYNFINGDAIRAFENIVNPAHWEFHNYVEMKNRRLLVQRNILSVNTNLSQELEGKSFQGQILVKEMFRGESQFSEESQGLKIGLPFVQGRWGSSYVEQDFVFQSEKGKKSYLKLAQLILAESVQALMDLLGQEQEREANILFETDENGVVTDFHEMNFSYSREESFHLSRERRRVQGQVYRMMPEAYHKELNLGTIAGKLLERDVNIYVHTMFHKEAFLQVSRMSEDDIDTVLDGYMEVLVKDQRKVPLFNRYGIINIQNTSGNAVSFRDRFTPHMQEFKILLKRALLNSSKLPAQARWEILKNLSGNRVFRQVGSGIFARLALHASRKYHKNFEDLMSFELRLNSGNGRSLKKSLGNHEKSEIMRKVLTARDRILGRKLKKVYWE